MFLCNSSYGGNWSTITRSIEYTITRLYFFFHTISNKVIHPQLLDELQMDVVQTLCELEMYFPTPLFDIMLDPVIWLVCGIKWCKRTLLRCIYLYKQGVKFLKRIVKNFTSSKQVLSNGPCRKKLQRGVVSCKETRNWSV